jgi:hypothetical protein
MVHGYAFIVVSHQGLPVRSLSFHRQSTRINSALQALRYLQLHINWDRLRSDLVNIGTVQ